MRRLIRRSLLVLPVALLGAAAFVGLQLRAAFPSGEPAARLDGSVTVHGVVSGGSCVWIIPTDTGALLIDSGGDPAAVEVVSALHRLGIEPEAVRGILLTHGYPRHVAGAARFPGVAVYAGPGERALISQERSFRSGLGKLVGALSPEPPPPSVGELEDGAVLNRDGRKIRVVSLPGHTLGSTAFLLDDSILFTGDAVLVDGNRLRAPPAWMNEDPAQAANGPTRLTTLAHATVADGHCRTFRVR